MNFRKRAVLALFILLTACRSDSSESVSVSSVESGQVLGARHENGQLWTQVPTITSETGEAVKHGTFTAWYDNGRKLLQGEYVNGKAEGLWTRWHQSGKLKSTFHDKGGEFHGVLTQYYEKGQTLRTGSYVDGKEEGVFRVWWEDGALKIEEYYQDGELEGVSRNYYPNGQLESEGKYVDGRKVGPSNTWYHTGPRAYTSYYSEGQLEGPSTRWNADGRIESERVHRFNPFFAKQ